MLAQRYQALREAKKSFEMVFVSSDRDGRSFSEYHASMPFPALPYSLRAQKDALSKMFGVRGIPILVFYDLKAKAVITTSGRATISQSSFVADFPYRSNGPLPTASGMRQPSSAVDPRLLRMVGTPMLQLCFCLRTRHS